MNLLFIDGEVVETAVEAVANNEVTLIEEQVVDAPMADATAQPAPAGSGTFWSMIIAMIAVMYFFMWRPESKRRKQMENFRNNLKKGDKIITAGGIYGTIKEIQPTSLLIEVDSNVTLRIDKNMVVGDPTQGIMQQ